jgi:hypothetical protein
VRAIVNYRLSNDYPIQWVPRRISSGVKRSGREANHLSPSSCEVENGGAIYVLPICLHGMMLYYLSTKHKENFSLRADGYSQLINKAPRNEMSQQKPWRKSRTCGSHGGDDGDHYLLGYKAVQSVKIPPAFRVERTVFFRVE